MPAQKIERSRNSAASANCQRLEPGNGQLHRAFECKDFSSAFGKMNAGGAGAESMNHHPEWFNVVKVGSI